MTDDPSGFIEVLFPRLYNVGYTITSVATPEYNCIAWAAEDDESWWWPDSMQTCYWPPQIPRKETREAFIQAYRTLGYELCSSSDFEEGYEKVAIYELNGVPTHAARQLRNGCWTSKLGKLEDIEHHTLDGLNGERYGCIAVVMKRPAK